MIITRKIEVYVSKCEKGKRREYINQLYNWRDLIRKAANLIVSHKFVQQNIRDFAYVQDDIMERFMELNPDAIDAKDNPKFFVKDILKNEKGNSEQNTTYRIVSNNLKGKCPSELFACLNQSVSSAYKEKIKDFLRGTASIPSYKNIPIPFPGRVLGEIRKSAKEILDDKTGEMREIQEYTLDFYHIPLTLFFGKDRSNNRGIIDKALSGEYKFSGSSLMIDDEKKKLFLLACLDVPQREVKLDGKKTMYAILGYEQPIMCSTDKTICTEPEKAKYVKWIGNREEFLHRRLQIQAAMRRLQTASRYSNGGHGRKQKTNAIDRFHEKEKNYIESRMHLYSKLLVEEAVNKQCATLYISNSTLAESDSGNAGVKPLLRNWGYHGLITMIEYKARLYSIRIIKEKEPEAGCSASS